MKHDEQAARALREALEELHPRMASAQTHDANVDAFRRALEAQSGALAAPTRARWPLYAAAAAVVGGVGLGALFLRSPAAPTPQPAVVVASSTDAQVLTPRPGVTLRTTTGTQFELRDEGLRLLLWKGEVAAEVTRRDVVMLIESSDTTYAVRGRATVTSDQGCTGGSQLQLLEGTATVGGRELTAPATWPDCHQAHAALAAPTAKPDGHHAGTLVGARIAVARPAPTPEKAAPAVTEPVAVATPAPVEVAPPPASVPTSALTPAQRESRLKAQNALFQEATRLHQAGALNDAVSKLDAVLVDVASPLSEAALAQKLKWLAQSDRSRAREVAEQYLRRFPRGFARADAENVVLESK